MRRLLLFIVCLILAFPLIGEAKKRPKKKAQKSTISSMSTPLSLERALHSLDIYIRGHMRRYQVPGLAIGIVHQGKVVFLRTYGVRSLRTQAPVTQETVFQLGSASKPIASTLVAILQKQGLLNLDAPVSDYLSLSVGQQKQIKQVTLRHLLSHSTGVPRSGFNRLIETKASLDHIHRCIEKTQCVCAPGECFDYHNVVYDLITPVIESAVNRSFENTIEKELFAPLGMKSATVGAQGILESGNYATSHVARSKRLDCIKHSRSYYSVPSAAGINANILDLVSFVKLQLGYFPKLLTSQDLKEYHSPQITIRALKEKPNTPSMKAHYGLGWRMMDIGPHRILYHPGWLSGINAYIGFVPSSDLGIVILQNTDTHGAMHIAREFYHLYLGTPTHWPLGHINAGRAK